MKLFVPLLLLAATAAAFGQNQQPSAPAKIEGAPVNIPSGALASPQEMEQSWLDTKAPDLLEGMTSAIGGDSQTGCPVTLTSAHLNGPASYLPVTSAEKVTEPSLVLGFENSSGRPIRSVTITARFLGKQNIYRLDAAAFDLRLTFSGVDAANNAADQLREIRVPNRMYAYGVTRVSLEQVLFADGTFWTAFGHSNCALAVQGSAARVGR